MNRLDAPITPHALQGRPFWAPGLYAAQGEAYSTGESWYPIQGVKQRHGGRETDSLDTIGVPHLSTFRSHSLIIIAYLRVQLRPNAATLVARDCIEIGQCCIEIEHIFNGRFFHRFATCCYSYS